MNPLEIQHITVKSNSLRAEVKCAIDMMYVSEDVAKNISAAFPGLSKQLCVDSDSVSDQLHTFKDEIVGTQTPHLLEHLAIEILGSVYSKAYSEGFLLHVPQFIGNTSWLEELSETKNCGYALMLVRISFQDELVALAALKEATRIINTAFYNADQTKNKTTSHAKNDAEDVLQNQGDSYTRSLDASGALARVRTQLISGLSIT